MTAIVPPKSSEKIRSFSAVGFTKRGCVNRVCDIFCAILRRCDSFCPTAGCDFVSDGDLWPLRLMMALL